MEEGGFREEKANLRTLRIAALLPIGWLVLGVVLPSFIMRVFNWHAEWLVTSLEGIGILLLCGSVVYLLMLVRKERWILRVVLVSMMFLLLSISFRIVRQSHFFDNAIDANIENLLRQCAIAFNGLGLATILFAFFWAIIDLLAVKHDLADELNFNRKLIAASHLGILAYQSSGECVLANEAMARLLGTTVDVLMRQNFRTIASWQQYGLLASAEAILAQGESYSGELLQISPFGKKTCCRYHMSPFVSGGVAHLLLIAEDISERVYAEKIIAEQRSMMVNTARMSALGVMAGGIAHEIRNPLAIISAGTQQLERLLDGQGANADQSRKTTQAIIRNVERIDGVIRALRSLSREGSSDPACRASVKQIVADAVDLCQYRFKENGVALAVSDIGDLEIECRAPQLSQVLLNLLNNAYDATEDHSERWVCLDVQDEGETVGFSVMDSGTGLPEDACDKVFLPFYTTKKQGKGVGLGLSISKSIVEKHNGTLEIDPQCPNTRFVLRIPKHQNTEYVPGNGAADPASIPSQ